MAAYRLDPVPDTGRKPHCNYYRREKRPARHQHNVKLRRLARAALAAWDWDARPLARWPGTSGWLTW